MTDECLMINVPTGGIEIHVWKKMSVAVEGLPRIVFSTVQVIKDALKQAFLRCRMRIEKTVFEDERLDNLIISDGVRMDQSARGINEMDLLNTLKEMRKLYGGEYQFKSNLEQIDSTYEIEWKLIVRAKKMKSPEIKITASSIHVMGGLPLQKMLQFRRQMAECYEEVTGRPLRE